jgi:hypothetical protein
MPLSASALLWQTRPHLRDRPKHFMLNMFVALLSISRTMPGGVADRAALPRGNNGRALCYLWCFEYIAMDEELGASGSGAALRQNLIEYAASNAC